MDRKKIITLSVSILFTGLLLLFILLNISIDEIINAVKGVSFKYAVYAFFFHFSAYIFRTLVFSLFFKEKKISYSYLLSVHLIHNFYIHLIPASLGELSFPLLLKKKIKIEESFSILFISRIIIIALTLALFVISVFYLLDIKSFLFSGYKNIIIILSIIVISIVFMYLSIKLLKSRKNIKSPLLNKIFIKILNIVDNSKYELTKLKNPIFSIKILIYSILSIFGLVFYYYFILKGMNINLSLHEIIFISTIGIAFIVLPIKSIGGFGTTEGSWAIGLMILGFSKSIAIQAGFVVHIFALINVSILFVIGITLKFVFDKYSNPQLKESSNEI